MDPKSEILNRLTRSLTEARRFMDATNAAMKSIGREPHYYGNRDLAAAKRASLDLTRSLAALRKPLNGGTP